MGKDRRAAPPEHPRKGKLAPSGVEEIRPPDDQVDLLPKVVHGHSELVGPVAVAVAEQQIAAFRREQSQT